MGTAYDEGGATNRSGETPTEIALPTNAEEEATITEDGSELERIAEGAVAPVLVVRRRRPDA